MSDRGIPANYRQMHGFGSHTFSFWNAKGERFWVKFHFKTEQGIANLTEEQAAKVKGIDPDHAQRDMVAAIQDGNFPSWKLKVQIMPEADANTYHINPFDLTKVWPHKDYPLIEVGVLELNRLPQNYFAEVEQVALAPSNLVPGVGASPDKMLQARLFAYADAQRYRIGANYNQLPVNCPMRLRPITINVPVPWPGSMPLPWKPDRWRCVGKLWSQLAAKRPAGCDRVQRAAAAPGW